MAKPIIFFIFIIFSRFQVMAQEITNIHFEQEGKMVNIYYDLKGEGTYDVKVYCSLDEGNNWGNPLIKVTGDVGKDQKPGIGNMIFWDVLAENEKLEGNITFKVEATSSQAGTFIDNRDGKTYKWVKLGNQVWMAENLNYETSSRSWCYDKQISNCTIYGRLYDWKTAINACPIGWHLPSDAEWTTLTTFLGGKNAGGKLKESGTSHWSSPNTSATNSSGFTALPGGYRDRYAFGYYYELGSHGYFWSSSEGTWIRKIFFDTADLSRYLSPIMIYGFSVRCLKD